MNQRCQIYFIFWWSCNAFGPNSRGSRHLWFPWKQGKSEGFDSCDWPQVVILLKLDSNRRFFSPCDLEIWWMTPQNNRASLLCYFKLFASFRSHWWIQTGVTVWKRLIWVKIDDFFRRLTLQFDGWPWKTIEHLFYGASSFVHHFVAIGEFKLELQSGNAHFGSNSTILEPCDLGIWWMSLKNYRAPLLCYFKLCSSFRSSHWWIQTGVTVRKRPIWVKFDDFFTSVNLTFDLWPWLFAWTSLLSLVITPENFVMIRWWEHGQNGVTDGRTDRQTDWTIHRAAWSQLKNVHVSYNCLVVCLMNSAAWSNSELCPKWGNVYMCYNVRISIQCIFSTHAISPYHI